ncbi:MAG: glycosyltransferase, partial [Candidatus Sumerlaeia bacterium]|nr:glycosyltransferase [Candidatus Sumerlaeia bacterium]
TLPKDLNHITHPMVGYFGEINERIDWDVITELAKKLPEVNFVFIGPVAVSLTALKKYQNLHFLGWRAYEILPRYLAGFDIAIVPYCLTAGVELVNPVKVLEYLAGEKPVISTDIADVRRFYGEAVFIAKDASEFIALIRQLITNPESGQEKIKVGKKLAQEKSWQMMAAEFCSLLEIPCKLH